MSKRWPAIQWGLLPVLVVPVILSLWRPGSEGGSEFVPNPPSQSDYYIRGARISVMDNNGQLLYQLRSKAIIHYPDSSAKLEDVDLYYEGQSEQHGTWIMAAEHGLIPPKQPQTQRQIDLSGDVRITGKRSAKATDLTQMLTQSATVYPEQGRFVTTAPVEFTQAGVTASATNMSLNSSKQSIHLQGNVRVTYASD